MFWKRRMMNGETSRIAGGRAVPTRRLLILVLFLLAFCLAAISCSPAPTDAKDSEETAATDTDEPRESGAPEPDGAFRPGSLPVITIHIDGGAEEVRKMVESEDHSYRCTGTMDLFVPEGYESVCAPALSESVSGLEMDYIRGRGNSSWSADKKPFKIKLAQKQDFFGMGKSKHWVLLANSSDRTLLRNAISLWLATELGMPYTPQFVFVDVVMDGEYLGSYYLAEQVRVEKSRTNLPELEEGMTREPDIWGGYLLALHPYDKDPLENRFTTEHQVDFLHETPSFAPEDGDYQNDAQRDYIRHYVQKVEDAIFAGDYGATAALLDLTSAADYWWIQEITENLDAYRTSSTYLYKEKTEGDGSEGKLYFGPVWDFDYTWGNVLNGTPDPEGFQHAEMPWTKELFLMPQFSALVKERWTVIGPLMEDMTAPDGILDRYAVEIRDSWEQDRKLWGTADGQPAETLTFDEEIEALRAFIRARHDWIDEHLGLLDHLYSTITLSAQGAFDTKLAVYTGSTLSIAYACTPPEIPGRYFIGWYTVDGEKAEEYLQITGDVTLDAHYIPESEVTRIEDLVFASDEVRISVSDAVFQPTYRILPEDAIDQTIHWAVSDEELAMVDEEGCVILLAPGDVTLTATLHSGKTVSCLIHIEKAKD